MCRTARYSRFDFKSFCSCNFLRTLLLPQVSAFFLALCFLTLKNYILFLRVRNIICTCRNTITAAVFWAVIPCDLVVPVSCYMRVEEVGKGEGKYRRRVWGQCLFCGTRCKWIIPVPNTSAGRTLGDSCGAYRKVINVFVQTVVVELPYNVNQQNPPC